VILADLLGIGPDAALLAAAFAAFRDGS